MRALALAFCLALPAAALAEAPPTYKARAALTVRAAPDAQAEAIGDLPPGAGPIETTAEADGWGRIPWQGLDGWVPLSRLAPATVPRLDAAAVPVGLVCAGTEPFWSLAFTGPAEAAFEAMDVPPVSLVIADAAVAAGRPDFPVMLLLREPRGGTVAVIRPLECSDGMSDQTYGWTLDYAIRGAADKTLLLLTGCCRLPISR